MPEHPPGGQSDGEHHGADAAGRRPFVPAWPSAEGAAAVSAARAAPHTVADARSCVSCGYNLRGLPTTGNCPECGTPVEKSLRGLMLRYASVEYLSTLQRGITVTIWGLVATVAVQILTVLLPIAWFGITIAMTPGGAGGGVPTPPSAVWMGIAGVLSIAASIVVAWGHWLMTTPDPGYTGLERPNSARQVARVASVAVVVCSLLASLSWLVTPMVGAIPGPTFLDPVAIVGMVIGLVNFAAWATRFFSMMLYVRWLANRVPDADIIAKTRTYMWLLPLLTVLLACAFMIGPLISLILYCTLLHGLRFHIRQFIAQQSVTA